MTFSSLIMGISEKSAAAEVGPEVGGCRGHRDARAAVLLRSAAPAAHRLARVQPHVARGMVSETLTLMKKSKKAAAMQREFVSDEDFERNDILQQFPAAVLGAHPKASRAAPAVDGDGGGGGLERPHPLASPTLREQSARYTRRNDLRRGDRVGPDDGARARRVPDDDAQGNAAQVLRVARESPLRCARRRLVICRRLCQARSSGVRKIETPGC